MLFGHVDLQTTQGYAAVSKEDLVRHYQDFLAHRRAQRLADDYTSEFEGHFDRRQAQPGSCGRPYGAPCQHRHACIRCPALLVEPNAVRRRFTRRLSVHTG